MTGRVAALALATFTFAANFWAWGLVAPLAPQYRTAMDLSSLQTGVLVAAPVLLGALLRVPVGGLTDRYGGRVVLTACSLVVVVPLGLLAIADTYRPLVAVAVLLGVAGASFAAGVPFVAAWFPDRQRGLALGVYGIGNIGTGLASFTAPGLEAALGRTGLAVTAMAVLAATAVLMGTAGRDAPGRRPPAMPFTARMIHALRLRAAQELTLLYAITFGGFVAFGVLLPTYLTDTYALSTADAAARTGGFIVLATLARPAGGWIADRTGGLPVLRIALGCVGVAAVVAGLAPTLSMASVAFLVISAALGAGNGAVFALVGAEVPQAQIGSVTGLVGAGGGLGGMVPPIVMGAVHQTTGSYTVGLMLLSAVAFAAMARCWWREAAGRQPAPHRQQV